MARSVRIRVPRPTVLEGLALALALAIVLTFVTPASFRPRRDPRATTRSDIDAIGMALETYRYDTGHYPTTVHGLAALVNMPVSPPHPWNWRGPYLLRPVPNDPWGSPYVYLRDEEANGVEGYVLLSYGADGRPAGQGGNADVTVRR